MRTRVTELEPTLIQYDLILTLLQLQRPYFSIRSHSQVPVIRTCTVFWGRTASNLQHIVRLLKVSSPLRAPGLFFLPSLSLLMPLEQNYYIPSQGTPFSLFNGALSHTAWQKFIDPLPLSLFHSSPLCSTSVFFTTDTHTQQSPDSRPQGRAFRATHRGLLIFSSLGFSLVPTIPFVLMSSFTSVSLEWNLLAEASQCFPLVLMASAKLSGTPIILHLF